MKKITGFILGMALLILLSSGILTNLCDYALWLFKLEGATKEISIFGNIVARLLTFGVTYSLVGGIFSYFGWFNSKAMSWAYAIISLIIGFILSYVVWTIEEHIKVILIVISIVLALSLIYSIFRIVKNNRWKKINE